MPFGNMSTGGIIMTRMLLFDVYVGKLRHTITSLICLLCGTFSLRFLGKSPHHLHSLISVAPPHVPHVQPKQGATLSVPLSRLCASRRVVAGNPIEAIGGNTCIDRASE